MAGEEEVKAATTTTTMSPSVQQVEEKLPKLSDEQIAEVEPTPETKKVVDDNAKVDEEDEVSKPTSLPTVDEKVDEEPIIKVNDAVVDNEKKALIELKELIRNALNNHEFSTNNPPPPPTTEAEEEPKKEEAEEKAEIVAEEETPKEVVSKTAEVEVKKVSVDEDGTKTVEAIEETVVSVIPSSNEQHQTPPVKTEESAVVEAKEEVSDNNTDNSSLVPEEVSIWGVPLLKDERTDTILWKFLLARDFKAKEAFTMIKNTIKWRQEFGIEKLLEEDLGDDLEKVTFMHGVSKEGNPVCYNVYGAFQDKELYQKAFSDEEKRQKFIKWRVQFLEKSIRKLDFSGGGISTIVQVNDLKDSPGLGKWELRQTTKQALQLFQDNYPEFVAKQVFINVPWWYVAVNKMISPFLTQRTKSKFVVAGPSKSAETLFNYVAAEQVPVEYGGLSKQGEFGTKDGATQIIVKPSTKETVEFAVTEACHLTWEVRVLGWEVSYGAEFVPTAKDGYTVIIQKIRKVGPSEETIITNSFKTSEPGKVVFTIDNSSSKKKRLLYRLKSITSSH